MLALMHSIVLNSWYVFQISLLKSIHFAHCKIIKINYIAILVYRKIIDTYRHRLFFYYCWDGFNVLNVSNSYLTASLH